MDSWIPLLGSGEVNLGALRDETNELGSSYLRHESQGTGDTALLDIVRNGIARILSKHEILIGSVLDVQMNFDDYGFSAGEGEEAVPLESESRVCGILADCYILEFPMDKGQNSNPYDIEFVIEAGVVVPESNGSLSPCIKRPASSTDFVFSLRTRDMISLKILTSE